MDRAIEIYIGIAAHFAAYVISDHAAIATIL
jgi:hypothetical protein